MVSLFENFTNWLELELLSKRIISDIEAERYNPSENNPQAAKILEEIMKESGEDTGTIETHVAAFSREAEKENVEAMAKAGKNFYGPKIEEYLTTKFEELYDETPKDIRKEIYNLLEHINPEQASSDLNKDIKKAIKLHSSIAGFRLKVSKYQSDRTSESEKEEIKKEIIGKLFDYYEERFLDSDEKKEKFQEMVEVLRVWVEKKPEIAINLFGAVYSKRKKEFEDLVNMDNLKEYLTDAVDVESLKKLYLNANRYYQQEKERKRIAKVSGSLAD